MYFDPVLVKNKRKPPSSAACDSPYEASAGTWMVSFQLPENS